MRLRTFVQPRLTFVLLSLITVLIVACENTVVPVTPDVGAVEDVDLTARVIAEEAILRQQPDVTSGIVTRVPKYTEVKVDIVQGQWFRVIATDVSGWALKEFFILEKASAISESSEPAATLVEPRTPLATQTAMMSRRTPTPKLLPTEPPQMPDAVVDTDVLNVREGPGTTYRRVAQVHQSDDLKVLGKANNCSWLKVTTPDNTSGWVSATFVRLNLQCTDISTLPTPTKPPPTATMLAPSTPTFTPTLMPLATPAWTPVLTPAGTSESAHKPFLMIIEDVFTITGRGTAVTGRITRGSIKPMDKVEIVGLRETRKTVATALERFHKTLDYAQAGDSVGILLRGIERDEIERGQVLAEPGSIQAYTSFEADIYIMTKEEGGRHLPFFEGYRPQFYFGTMDVTGAIHLPEGIEMVMPGDEITTVSVELIVPVAMEQGTQFAIREGGRTIGRGWVTQTVD